ncbi:MAG: acetyl-CoA carboxylase biotin carboxyl carrier protein [Candidatus Eisenbacteria bacterium]|uniref:Biotin carboxyl carrier protein of acetyl-CoA carboxylase n=1 Tax=Eiseniibacteriota bacterium TaxID=2212470 RepID=A0A9D6L9S9_UNCEI|nr:acetyl-CoA carboxylase biotin carboxyl carrier protein [Candidatus Eisenbacteria bacterium]MBI3539522.1 acetyl-CoA carboxylase biotin carboxyl carrier protein [Candidatus Eisenbacteria bacterium]
MPGRRRKGAKAAARAGAVKSARPPRAVKSARSKADNSTGTLGGFAVAELRRLIRLVQRTGIGELEVTADGRTVRIAATAGSANAAVHVTAPAAGPAHAAAPAPAAVAAESQTPIVSPMVGTFYRAPAPDADPYVEVGDVVEVGQTVCIIEAMKLMNEIESETKGRIVRILVENAQPVEFGQKLFLIEPL